MWACENGYATIVQLLLDKGVDFSIRDKVCILLNKIALKYIIYLVSVSVYFFIIQNGDTAFQKAVRANQIETMKVFCSGSGKEVTTVISCCSYPPISSSDQTLDSFIS